jgi:23S rRNA pseudouridine2605 synthase
LNKPKACVTTVSDPEGRETVMHLLRGVKERVFPVGRLDYHSEGLLLLTNDGEFAHRITAPASHVVKTYVVKVNGALSEEQERAFRAGRSAAADARTAPAELKLIKPGTNPWYESEDCRGPAESDPDDVQAFRAPGGEAAAREDRVPGTGCAAGENTVR